MPLSPAAINSMLGGHTNIFKQTPALTPTPKILKKHYSEHAPHYEHHEPQYNHEPHYDHHEEHHYNKKQSRSVALTALTLLAFLFFLHILQQCLHDQVEMSTTPTTVVMQANILASKLSKEAQDRVGESPNEEPEVTTPFDYGIEERHVVTKDVNVKGNVYQYEKVHVPVKMKVIEKNNRLKRI